jgi:hypothetical protein
VRSPIVASLPTIEYAPTETPSASFAPAFDDRGRMDHAFAVGPGRIVHMISASVATCRRPSRRT